MKLKTRSKGKCCYWQNILCCPFCMIRQGSYIIMVFSRYFKWNCLFLAILSLFIFSPGFSHWRTGAAQWDSSYNWEKSCKIKSCTWLPLTTWFLSTLPQLCQSSAVCHQGKKIDWARKLVDIQGNCYCGQQSSPCMLYLDSRKECTFNLLLWKPFLEKHSSPRFEVG